MMQQNRFNDSRKPATVGLSGDRNFQIKALVSATLLIVLAALVWVQSAQAAEDKVRVGLLKFGTVNWELKSMISNGFDKANGIQAEIVPYASGDATRIALQGGEVDVIVADWLWVSRQRASGADFVFVPYSSAVGAIMVSGESSVAGLKDMKGLKIGVAGGPLDKNWLMLQGLAKKDFEFDLAKENEIVFGAPPLLAEKTREGELDAMLNFWHFCARLEAIGFKRVISGLDAAAGLGAEGTVSAIGYVFSEAWAEKNPEAAAGFVKASRATKELLKTSDDEWNRLASEGAIKDKPDALAVLRDRFREGIPNRAISDEIVDAGTVYGILAQLGGKKLVGDSPTMAEGTYWTGMKPQ